MAELITVARPYAQAVFQLAQESNTAQLWSEALSLLGAVAKEAQAIVNNPKLSHETIQTFLFDILGDKVSEEVKNFVIIVLENRRFAALPMIAEMYEAMRAQSAGVAKAVIESAFAMDDSEVAQLTTALTQHFKTKIEPKVEINPELIGGVRVTVGDEVLDASIRGKLSRLSASLK